MIKDRYTGPMASTKVYFNENSSPEMIEKIKEKIETHLRSDGFQVESELSDPPHSKTSWEPNHITSLQINATNIGFDKLLSAKLSTQQIFTNKVLETCRAIERNPWSHVKFEDDELGNMLFSPSDEEHAL